MNGVDTGADGPEDDRVVEHEYDGETPASIAVVQTLCVLADVDPIEAPTELGFVLHDRVDPDALDTILADGSGDGETVVSFELDGDDAYAVEIRDDGRIVVRRRS